MELVTGATTRLLPKLGALLKDEYKLQDKVKKDIESLQNELVFMNATLRMVAEVPRDQLDEHVRVWAFFIKEVSYDMEEVVNTFVTRVHTAPYLDGIIRKAFNMVCMGSTHHEIAGMVEEIKRLIKEVVELRDRYRLDNIVTRPATLSSVVVPQRDNTFVRFLAAEYDVMARRLVGITYKKPVGRKLEMKHLHNWITSSDRHCHTLSLLGPSGVGKTTIATALYREYGHNFQRRVMVKVPQDTDDHKAFFLDMLNQVKPWELQDHGGDIGKIKSELHSYLDEERFFLLLDDVWSLTTLEEIGRFLPNRDNGSRIIVTTRSDLVARAIEKGKTGCVAGCVCKVDPLNYRNARQLFKKVMCTQYWNVPSRLLEICSGLPLAIVTMAGRFACDPWKSSEEWTEIYRSLTPTLGTSHTDYSLTKVLSSCYNDMPVEIKACSLYFSIFPRGQKVNRKRLTRRWISDGFVNEQQGLKAEEVAEAYLTHLVRRKVLRAVEHNSNGKVKSYQVVHDKVLENIVSRANEENFVTTIGGCGVLPSSTKVRRLSAQFNSSSKYGKELEIMNLSHVRDVTMFGSLEQLPPSLLKFKIVQVLDLEGCKGFKQQFTDEICRNSLLKYLSLRRTDIKKLTKRIGNLQFLETLDIRETDVIELPKAIYKLERLANLFGGNKKTRKALKLPKGEMRKMKSLRILTGVEIGEEKISDLNNMPTLRKLSIYKLKTDKSGYFFRFLSYAFGMTPLTSLVIHDESSEFSKALDQVAYPFESIDALEFSGKLVQLPKWITKRNTLTKLTLPVMALRADNLVILSKIDSLFTLTFSLYAAEQDAETAAIVEANKALPGGVILFPVGGFENLKLLRFSVPYLPHLSFPKGALPTLERLELRFSDGYRPDGMEELKNLREVQIRLHGETRETASSISHLVNEVHTGTRVIFD